MVKGGICPWLFSATRGVLFLALLIILIFPVHVSADEYKVLEEQKIEDENKEKGIQEELPDKKPTSRQVIDELEISIKPKVDDTIRSECIHPPLKVKYGITPNWEFSLRLNTFLNNPLRGETRNGVSDVSIGTRYHWERFFKYYIDVITAFSVQIPAGNSEDVYDEYTHYRPELKFIKTVPDWHRVQFSTTINMDILSGYSDSIEIQDQDQLDNSLSLTVGALFPIAPFKYSIETEWITTEVDEGNKNSVYLISGIYYEMLEKKYPWTRGAMNLGLGVRIGLNDTDDTFAFFARLNWDFPLKMHLKKRSKKESHLPHI